MAWRMIGGTILSLLGAADDVPLGILAQASSSFAAACALAVWSACDSSAGTIPMQQARRIGGLSSECGIFSETGV